MNRLILLSVLASVSALAADRPLSFVEALDGLVARDPSLAASRASLESAETASLNAKFQLIPTVNVGAAHSYAEYSSYTSEGQKVELTSQYNLFRFGADRDLIDSKALAVNAAQSSLLSSSEQAEYTAAATLLNYIYATRSLEVTREVLDNAKASLTIARERFKKGLLAHQEVDKIEVDLENTRTRLVDAELSYESARSTLVAALGHDRVQTEWPWMSTLEPKKMRELLKSLDFTAPRNQTQALKLSLESAELSVSRARKQRLPTLDASLAAGLGNGVFNSPEGFYWSGYVSLSFALFDQASNQSTVDSLASFAASQRSLFETSLRDQQSQVETTQAHLMSSVENAQNRERITALARKLSKDARARFRLGRMNSNDLSYEESRLYESELLTFGAWKSAHLEFLKTCHLGLVLFKECLKKIGKK